MTIFKNQSEICKFPCDICQDVCLDIAIRNGKTICIACLYKENEGIKKINDGIMGELKFYKLCFQAALKVLGTDQNKFLSSLEGKLPLEFQRELQNSIFWEE